MTESLVDNGSLSFRMVSEFSIRFGPQIYRIDGAVCQSREQDHAVGMCALKRKAFVLDRDLPSPYRTRVPSCSRPSRPSLRWPLKTRPALTATARDGTRIERPGRENAPQGPN